MEDDGLDDLFRNRRIGAATISRIRDLDLKAQDLLVLSPQFLAELCQTVGASDGERFKILAAVGAAQHSAVTGIRGFGSRSEGLNARLYISERKDLLEKLESLVRKERAVVVRAPPQSGKTSLLQLLKARTESKFSDVFCISLAGINGHSFEYMWYQHYPHVSMERLNSSEPTLLLVDEGQSGFHASDLTLWAKIKSAQAGGMLHIVLVSSFGSDEGDTDEGELPPTPVIFKPSCAVTIRPQHGSESSGIYLQFSDAECSEIWENWCKFCAFVPNNNDILYYVMEVGDRQPGLMTHMLDWLVRRKFNDKYRDDREEFAKSELLSERFMASLSEIRSISTFRNMYWRPEYAGILSKLLGSSSALGFVKKTELSSEELRAANKLLRRGQLVRTKAMNFMFPSPLHRHYYASLCATATLMLPQVQTMGIESFLVHVIQRMSAGRLACSESLATEDGTIYERQYQNEFYRAYCTLLDVPMSLDVGRLYGVAGYVDFYLADLKWAFEIARDGIKLGEVKCRYHALISKGVVKKYVVVNMDATGVVYKDEVGLVQVIFADGYRTATIYPSGQEVVLQA